ncbi:MAG: phosphonate ABC transporter, permease protein PhnE [Bdellovibrionales bacterium]|nr:phosphonate ABC transporter, permease protein PhnE [Bdellovibrionales bacterium]
MGTGVYQSASSFAGYLGITAIISLLWTRAPLSFGTLLVNRTNPVLKGLSSSPSLKQWSTSLSGMASILLILLTFALGWKMTEMNVYTLFSMEGLAGAKRIFTAILQPNINIIDLVIQYMIVTIFIALMATTLAIPIAFLMSFFMARNLAKSSQTSMTIYTLLRFLSNFTRSVEPLIWAIVFSVWVGIGPFAGMMALMIHSIAALTKLYSEQIENIDKGPIEAIEATGANRIQVIWYAVVPQIILPYLSFTIYRWDINIRMATIIGLVGGGGVGTLLMQYQGLAKWNEVGTVVIVIAVVVWVMDYLSARIREAIY